MTVYYDPRKYPAKVYPYVIVTNNEGEDEVFSFCKNETIALEELAKAERWVKRGVYKAAFIRERN